MKTATAEIRMQLDQLNTNPIVSESIVKKSPSVKNNNSAAENFSSILSAELQQWKSVNNRLGSSLKSLSNEQRDLLESQLIIQQINLRTHLTTQIAEAATSSLKKLQQFGA
ncbi:MAG: hypothetical protein IT292_00290 [Deltaproteobacteria bacterium]|nr:hypothetical protein [Deltaproteobacteria bacterium]